MNKMTLKRVNYEKQNSMPFAGEECAQESLKSAIDLYLLKYLYNICLYFGCL